MPKPTFVCDYEVTGPLPERNDLHRYGDALILLRIQRRPVGFIRVPIVDGRLDRASVVRRMLKQHGLRFGAYLAGRAIDEQHLPALDVAVALAPESDAEHTGADATITVAVCTRDRTANLACCLDSLVAAGYEALDVVVIDNAPSDDGTEVMVRTRYPGVRYVREPRPGLDWARNRAILECRREILAFTDDDVLVDRHWVGALADVFSRDPQVMAVTGLVIPAELESNAQSLFEQYGGFGRGFVRRWFRAPAHGPLAPLHGGTGKFGTGANMAFRRRLFDDIGGFDTALDVGTATNGGGDLDMFFRVLKAGHTLVYEPAAIVRHRHRESYAALRTQIANNGVGFYSYLVRNARAFSDERASFARLGAWWLWWWNVRRLLRSFLRRESIPRDLIVAELRGSLQGLRRYATAVEQARAAAAAWPDEPMAPPPVAVARPPVDHAVEAVRRVEIAEPLAPITDATAAACLRLSVSWNGVAIGTAIIEHHGAVVSPAWLRDAITQQLAAEVLAVRSGVPKDILWMRLISALAQAFPLVDDHDRGRAAALALSPAVSVSVVVATRDRPHDLEQCLSSLTQQRTPRRLEIIVVDNNPGSGITRGVAASFPGVVVVDERRPGLSFARNQGIRAATGEIIVSTDDDVTCPSDWIERLVAPFTRDDVMVVTGNVLPAELETPAQRLFEAYGGLGRGWQRRIVDRDWFRQWRRAVPTWNLGCTANAAFRARLFSDPAIGLMDEALGAGTPTGCSEDTYVFYRVLKAGHAIAYEPDAVVWHRHRRSMKALRRQIYSYAKGHVAYQLTTWLRDGDRRGLVRIVYELPRTYLRRAWARLRGRSRYPLTFIGLEVLGTLAGPLALWRSRRRASRLGALETYALHLESPRAEVSDA
jgi:GT2 family glycosyltransferase